MMAKSGLTLEELAAHRHARYRKAAEKLRQWSREDHEYDDRVGAILEQEFNASAFKQSTFEDNESNRLST